MYLFYKSPNSETKFVFLYCDAGLLKSQCILYFEINSRIVDHRFTERNVKQLNGVLKWGKYHEISNLNEINEHMKINYE